MNRLDSVFLVELSRGLVQKMGVDLPDTLRHRRDHPQDVRCNLIRWLHGAKILSFDRINCASIRLGKDFTSSLLDQRTGETGIAASGLRAFAGADFFNEVRC